MTAAVATDADTGAANYDVDVDLLLRNARKIDVATERENETESWSRGKSNAGDATVANRDPLGVRVVELPGGSPHGTLLVESAGDDTGPFAGACDCDGFMKHQKPCAHLVARAVRSILRDGEVPVDVQRYQSLVAKAEATEQDGDVDEVDDVQEASADATAEAMSDVGGLEAAGATGQTRTGPEADDVHPTPVDVVDEAPATADGDPFAAELRENVPERYVMEMGGEPYIRRAGYAAIARQADLRLSLEAVVPAEETDFEHARYVATVRDQDGGVLVEGEVGTAHLASEDLAGAEAQLDELAATRASRRAIEWATGAGATLRRDGR